MNPTTAEAVTILLSSSRMFGVVEMRVVVDLASLIVIVVVIVERLRA